MSNEVKEGQVITIICPIGEFIAEHGGETENGLRAIKPRMLVNTGNDIGFAPGVAMTGELEPEECVFYSAGMITVVPTADKFAEAWKEYTCAPSIARV